MILVIDNYDSFVHNLARYFRLLGVETKVVRNDAIELTDIEELKPVAIVISPGPCAPNEAGISLDIVSAFANSIPILGVCLGHQVIVQALGGEIVRAWQPMHGRTSEVTHTGSALFEKVPDTFSVGRYHSLIAETQSLPPSLKVTSRISDGTIMSVEHETLPLVGVQFHPESILTHYGHRLLCNFLKIAGCLPDGILETNTCENLMDHEIMPMKEDS